MSLFGPPSASRTSRRLVGAVLISGLAALGAASPALALPAQDTGGIDPSGGVIIDPPPPPPADLTIRGSVYIGGPPVIVMGDGSSGPTPLPCSTTPDKVTLTATKAGVTRSVKPVASPLRNAFGGWSYSFTGLPRGSYTVTPRLDAGVCQYGGWSPTSKFVPLPTATTNPVASGVDFSYLMPTKVTRVAGATVAGYLDAALGSTQLHLDNFGPQHGLSHHEANASFLSWGGSTTTFDIPEIQYDLDCGLPCPDAGQARLYVNDVNLTGVDVGWTSPAFVLDTFFEENGREVKGFQSYDSSWDYLDFVTDDTVPDFEISNARLRVRMVPVADGAGRLTYSLSGAAEFTGNINATGGCGTFDFICDYALDYKSKLADKIESKVGSALGGSAAKAAVGEALKPRLAALGIASVRAVFIEGADIVIAS